MTAGLMLGRPQNIHTHDGNTTVRLYVLQKSLYFLTSTARQIILPAQRLTGYHSCSQSVTLTQPQGCPRQDLNTWQTIMTWRKFDCKWAGSTCDICTLLDSTCVSHWYLASPAHPRPQQHLSGSSAVMHDCVASSRAISMRVSTNDLSVCCSILKVIDEASHHRSAKLAFDAYISGWAFNENHVKIR